MKLELVPFLIVFFCVVSCNMHTASKYEIGVAELTTNTDASLRGLHVVDENVIWASGSAGTVLNSVDGGEKWNVTQIEVAIENDFRSIHAWDKDRAMVFGVAGPQFGYYTEDGGKNWDVVFKDSTKGLFFNSLKFADENNGLAVSDPVDGKFFVLRTENGGKEWKRVMDLPKTEEGEANFAASNTCIEFLSSGMAWIASGGKEARVFYSEDFGKSWKVTKTPMIRGQASSGIFSISFKNDFEGVIVGGVYDQPELNSNIASYTVDGGKTWFLSETMPKEYRSCVQNVSDDASSFIFAIGKTGCDISFDKGVNWQFLNEAGFYTFRSVPGKLEGFAAGADGKISKLQFIKN